MGAKRECRISGAGADYSATGGLASANMLTVLEPAFLAVTAVLAGAAGLAAGVAGAHHRHKREEMAPVAAEEALTGLTDRSVVDRKAHEAAASGRDLSVALLRVDNVEFLTYQCGSLAVAPDTTPILCVGNATIGP